MPVVVDPQGSVRLDRYLWAARFFKTRSLAKAAVEGGKVEVDGQRAKPAKEIKVGQTLQVRRGDEVFKITVAALSDTRGPASVARTLYVESEASIEAREAERARRRMERAGLQVPSTRPNKKDRRELRNLKNLAED